MALISNSVCKQVSVVCCRPTMDRAPLWTLILLKGLDTDVAFLEVPLKASEKTLQLLVSSDRFLLPGTFILKVSVKGKG